MQFVYLPLGLKIMLSRVVHIYDEYYHDSNVSSQTKGHDLSSVAHGLDYVLFRLVFASPTD